MEPKGTLIAAMTGIPHWTYREENARRIPSTRLSDEEYGEALRRFIGVCADIVIMNSARREIYLARRRSKPMTGWWWLGGGNLVNETSQEAAARNFTRETKLIIDPSRFVYRVDIDYFWKDRQQEPQNYGCHMEGKTFTVELRDEEIDSIKLDPDEFDASEGLTPFTREMLVREGVYPAILNLYDLIFPETPFATKQNGALLHVVLISFRECATVEQRQTIYDRYQTLNEDCGGKNAGILYWKVEHNHDLRKNVHLVEIAIFTGNEALQAFRAHPKHVAMGETLRTIADWYVGDIT